MNFVNEDCRQEVMVSVRDKQGQQRYKRLILSVVPQRKSGTIPCSGVIEGFSHLAYRTFGITLFFPLLAISDKSYIDLAELGNRMYEQVKEDTVNLAGLFDPIDLSIPFERLQIKNIAFSLETHSCRRHTCTCATKFLHHLGTGCCLPKNDV